MSSPMSEKLKKLREENGFSQEYVAKLLHVDLHFVVIWEAGDELPMPSQIRELAALYGVSPSFLFASDSKEQSDTVTMYSTVSDSPVVKQNEIHEEYRQNTEYQQSVPPKRSRFSERVRQKTGGDAMYPSLAKLMFVFPFPLFIVGLYIFLGFSARIWHPTWLMFLLIPVYYMFAAAATARNKKVFLLLQPVPLLITILYLMLGFSFHLWWSAWVLYLLIPAYYFWVLVFVKGKKK